MLVLPVRPITNGLTDPCPNVTSTTLSSLTRSPRSMRRLLAPMGRHVFMASYGTAAVGWVVSGWRGSWAAHGLVGVHGRRKWRRGKPNTAPAPDLLRRDFTAAASDNKWVADITEFACWDGKLFLAGIKDLHDQSIVGWSMGTRQTTDLVVNALVMALSRRHPTDDDLIHHADRGPQYTSLDFATSLADWGINASYSRTGTCFDNAAMESTWATFKKEIKHIHGDWSEMTRSQLRTALFAYIETFYNRQRHQARLGHRTPTAVYADHAA